PLTRRVGQATRTSDSESHTFGTRTIKSYLSPPGTRAWGGSRWISINGKPFVFRGGGMMDQDMFLRFSKERLGHEIQLIKQMGLNGFRLEGDDQPDVFYQEMDKAGLLVYGGWRGRHHLDSPHSWSPQ